MMTTAAIAISTEAAEGAPPEYYYTEKTRVAGHEPNLRWDGSHWLAPGANDGWAYPIVIARPTGDLIPLSAVSAALAGCCTPTGGDGYPPRSTPRDILARDAGNVCPGVALIESALRGGEIVTEPAVAGWQRRYIMVDTSTMTQDEQRAVGMAVPVYRAFSGWYPEKVDSGFKFYLDPEKYPNGHMYYP